MGYYRVPLKANEQYRLDVPGTLILVDEIDGAPGVDITPLLNGTPQNTMPNRRMAFRYRTQFDGVQLHATADCTVALFLTTNDVSLGFTDQVSVQGAVEVTNGEGNRVLVDIAGGAVNVTADNVGINNTEANPVPVKVGSDDAHAVVIRQQALTTLVDHAPATINTGAAQLLVSDATFRSLRIRNASTDAVIVIGGASVSLTNAAIELQPGDTWIETNAPGAAWYAVSDTNGADVRVMGVK